MKTDLLRTDGGGSCLVSENPGESKLIGSDSSSTPEVLQANVLEETRVPGLGSLRIRLWFSKSGDLRLISHLDLMRCFERLIRRAAIPIASSQGFNPRPKIVFGLALALGVEGRRELVELELAAPMEPQVVLERLRNTAPEGLQLLEAVESPSSRPPTILSVSYEISVPAARAEQTRELIRDFLRRASVPFTRLREGRSRDIDLRPFLLAADVGEDGRLEFQLEIDPAGSARPEEILEALGLEDLLKQGSVLCAPAWSLPSDRSRPRTSVWVQPVTFGRLAARAGRARRR